MGGVGRAAVPLSENGFPALLKFLFVSVRALRPDFLRRNESGSWTTHCVAVLG